ncbi:glycosyl hydrolase family 3 N terminal domain-containing protein [Pseudomassariella vexata]|uniref:beta-glucosidase n=1 Tax=Pseudomassariella vexata TaxID=1141098 RepID=A0A1Y2EJJ2_9PEZI|nr:glycosyl hydrolase family 3 N terminal domain-containing protein [Pseudomassariella vexata]ORY71720.1 glycosyl hydrolase family 3 N terminal domain-domain-containing protein [Pseudomassariella vexata]
MVIIFDPEVPSGSRSLWFLALSSLLISPSSGAALEARDGVPAGYVAAPYYPTPHGGWADDWEGSYAKAVELVSQMTLAEKTNITAGSGFFMGEPCVGNTGSALRVGFPQLCLQDGPLGVRSTDNVTAFPAGITTGATFSKSLMYERGVALGEEFKGKGANMYLGPSVGPLGRKPRGGRNWEAFGSDPVLQGVAGAQTIKGVQEQGVIAVLKHLIGNEQEMWRMYNPFQPAYSSNIDDRTMHELYLWPFAEGVHAGTGAAMISYNAVNGSADSQNSYNINGLLKDELGFQGLVMTDWLAHLSGVDSALSGLDMDMPGDTQIPLFGNSYWMYELTRSALNGSVPMDRLNDMATRIVATWYKMGQDQDYPEPNFSSNTRDREGPLYPGALLSPSGVVNQYVNVQAEHKVVAKQVAQEAVTLLKNNGSFLPITTTVSLSVFGTDAQADPQGINSCTDKSCNRGTLGMGWGSGSADYPYMDDPISSLKRKAGTVTYYATDSFPTVPMPSDDDVAIVFISSDSGENSYTVENNHGDRDTDGLKAWHGGDALVQKAAAKYNNVIVVVHTVGPIIMEPWIDLPSVKAVLVAHLPGQEAGDSLTEILFGEVSPSGHLPYSIPVAESDYPSSVSNLVGFAVGQPQDTYSEGLYIDYRSLNKQKIRARFAFGHGLSYASFNFSSISITPVTSLSTVPPTRPVKSTSPIATMNTTIPSASEAVAPAGFNMIWRYLYSWLSESDANAAYAEGQSGAVYAYPAGYSTKQKVGPPAGGPNGGNPALWDVAYTVSVTVINTGETNHSGKAVPQAYVQFPSGMPYDTPVIQLRDFEKTGSLAPGESEAVELSITRKDLSVWDVELQNWVAPGAEGQYKIWVGEASDDLGVVCYTDSLRCEVGFAGPV